ncbi:MAG: FmdB family zinc ribbon protein [Myxococcota bacterium]
MRMYDFECESCGHRFEELVRGTPDGSEMRCPACEHVGARKLITGFSVGQSRGSAPAPSAGPGCSGFT